MNYDLINNVQSCYIDIPPLLYYSHIPTMFVALFMGIIVFVKNRTLISKILLGISVVYALWISLNLIAWLSVDSVFLMLAWSFFGILYVLLFLCCYYFLYVFIKKKDVSLKTKIVSLLLCLPALIFAFTKYNVNVFNSGDCVILMEPNYLSYIHSFGLIVFISMVIFSIVNYIKEKNKDARKQIVLVSFGLLFFIFSFFTTDYLAEKMMDLGLVSNFFFEFYGLFGMAIFMAFLAYLIVKFKAFDIKLIATQALVWGVLILVGSQFFFIQSNINKILNGITLVLSSILGLVIVRGVKREIALREELEMANRNQESLIHFVSHQLKGFFTKSKMIFAGIIEGDFGKSSEDLKDVAKEGLLSDNNAVSMIQEVLGASNLKKGTTTYNMKEVDFADIVRGVCEGFQKEVGDRGLEFIKNIPDSVIKVLADSTQIEQVVKNLIDNSLKYTPKGSVEVSLSSEKKDGKDKVLLMIKDTGIGLSESDKKKLFTEGGRGEESIKTNVNSTGYGLYIVKKIVENHGGKIWAESDGRGLGSRFYVELSLIK